MALEVRICVFDTDSSRTALQAVRKNYENMSSKQNFSAMQNVRMKYELNDRQMHYEPANQQFIMEADKEI